MAETTNDSTKDLYVLEFTLISAQNLASPIWALSTNLLGRRMKTYAKVWINKDTKLSTRIDEFGGSNPFWNHKFLFLVDKTFLLTNNNIKRNYLHVEIFAAGLMFNDGYIGGCSLHLNDSILKSEPYVFNEQVIRRSYWSGENGAVQGMIFGQTKLLSYQHYFCQGIDKVFHDRLSIMCHYCQPNLTQPLRPLQSSSSFPFFSSEDVLVIYFGGILALWVLAFLAFAAKYDSPCETVSHNEMGDVIKLIIDFL
ncbi:Protein SRC2-like protein [Bienertia sinuspersici]